jgi:hypothetical protein
MNEGRKVAAQTARLAAVQRVLEFREWMDADVQYRREQREFIDYQKPMTMKRKPTPPLKLPSDNDYKIAREEGAIT